MAFLAIVTAAGRSRRMGGANKLMLPLGGRPLLLHCLETLQSYAPLSQMVVTAAEGEEDEFRRLFEAAGLTKVTAVVRGGAERQESIGLALEALAVRNAAPADLVAIHDGARPFLTHQLLDSLLRGLEGFDGVLPMVPVKDTVKVVRNGQVARTLPRSELMAAQTPQVFAFDLILKAHRAAMVSGYLGTDDCSLIEWRGGRVGAVEGEYRNLKVTTPEDLLIAESLYQETSE